MESTLIRHMARLPNTVGRKFLASVAHYLILDADGRVMI
jgi:hypothetical protein